MGMLCGGGGPMGMLGGMLRGGPQGLQAMLTTLAGEHSTSGGIEDEALQIKTASKG